ncbi:hypothetical protein PRIPAC_92477 [Pristionchus pacificus]|uniref:G protein-coupled receptor n=1 Tax=Pristionchus pacificus TaxID=54126 RepID=A0A2A6BA14_PRIPA|nr:hypothetical protein PRIPAC_92477 [Pristionchus pacificus]|eukprot:PDM62707.1 G protein-coupled receptor [Pristionchus pacificus]
MIGAQYEFMPDMLRGPEYNCSEVMPSGPAWADKYGVKRPIFGWYSLVFGIIVEILYIPCLIALRKDARMSCIKIMFCLALLDMVGGIASSVGFGVLLIQGAVFCSDPVFTAGIGIVGYGNWCMASSICIVLAVNRLFEMLNLSKYFTVRISLIVNSSLQSMSFSPFIPGHGKDEYVNIPHAVHDMVIVTLSCLLYMALCTVLVMKRKAISPGTNKVFSNTPIFVQAMLICGANLGSSLIYVSMNFIPLPPSLIVAGHVSWQISNGSPPFIYFALNKSIRNFTLRSIGLGRLGQNSQVHNSTTQRSPITF